MTQPGDIVQVVVDPGHWLGCLVVVEECANWGIKGYTLIPGPKGGRAYIRLAWEDFVTTGGTVETTP